MSSVDQHEPFASPAPPHWKVSAEALLVFVIFALFAGWPMPEPNEPHYLSKARHYWDPAWIQHDFFLDSADSHTAFYLTVGWLARVLPLPWFALVGRLLSWALLAMAWRRLCWALVPQRGAATISALLLVGLSDNDHLAGEWIVGGFEAKGFAFALVFLALAALARGRWNLAWILVGCAAMFHVLVGGWAGLAIGVCWLASGTDRPRLSTMWPGLLACAALALPSVLQGLALNRGATADVVAAANEIYVYRRLPHHLSFFDIRPNFIARFTGLTCVWAALWFTGPRSESFRRIGSVVWASLLFVLVGIGLSVVGFYRPDLAAPWLRFYWFRLADALVPLGVALWAVEIAFHPAASYARWGRARPWLLAAIACAVLSPTISARWHNTTPRADKPGKVANYSDWREACEWAAEHAPAGARFLTPRTAQTFKWYAGRSEVVTWKDMPQDAAGIVEWWNRLQEIHGTGDPDDPWYDSLAEIKPAQLRAFGAKYHAGYLLTEAQPELDLPCPFRNGTYAIYELSP